MPYSLWATGLPEKLDGFGWIYRMMRKDAKQVQIPVSQKVGVVSGLLIKPQEAGALLAHGAGAGMRHPFMEKLAGRLAGAHVATLRYQFPYMEKHIKRPDSEGVLKETVRAAIVAAKKHAGGLPLFAGGKSMGARMTSLAAADQPLEGVRGMIFFGFPLHSAGRPAFTNGRFARCQSERSTPRDFQLFDQLGPDRRRVTAGA